MWLGMKIDDKKYEGKMSDLLALDSSLLGLDSGSCELPILLKSAILDFWISFEDIIVS